MGAWDSDITTKGRSVWFFFVFVHIMDKGTYNGEVFIKILGLGS